MGDIEPAPPASQPSLVKGAGSLPQHRWSGCIRIYMGATEKQPALPPLDLYAEEAVGKV